MTTSTRTHRVLRRVAAVVVALVVVLAALGVGIAIGHEVGKSSSPTATTTTTTVPPKRHRKVKRCTKRKAKLGLCSLTPTTVAALGSGPPAQVSGVGSSMKTAA